MWHIKAGRRVVSQYDMPDFICYFKELMAKGKLPIDVVGVVTAFHPFEEDEPEGNARKQRGSH